MNLSIKNVPETVVQRLKQRAARGHRSLQGELLRIVETAAEDEARRADRGAFFAELRASGLRTPSDSVEIIRADRDGR